jgi:quercetin dioxygenase-like cupin family protein
MTVPSGGAYHFSGSWPEVEAAPGVRRRVLSCGDQLMIVQFTIDAEATVPLHTHPHEQIGHIVSGRMHFQIGDEVRELGPGDGYSVPGGVTHGAIGITEVVAVDSFHPVRDDCR